MRFYSGFSLQGEAVLFRDYLHESDYTVAGFSRGAIDALQFVLETDMRIDRLQLISPAFFMDKDADFKSAQLMYFRKNPELYMKRFLQNIAYPSSRDLSSFMVPEEIGALERLLYYRWDERDLKALEEKGIRLEVYLGGRDRIIDADAAKRFFQPYAAVYFIKEGGHILDGQN